MGGLLRINGFLAFVLWLSCLPTLVVTQSVDATVVGTVADSGGGILPGATVTATSAATGLVRSTTSDGSGRYVLRSLPAGRYEIRAEMAGMTTEIRREQEINVGTTVTVDFTLNVGGLAETVEVRSETPLLETSKNTLSRTVQSKEIDALPVVGRDFAALAALAPGVTRTGPGMGVEIGGNRGFQNAVQVDGVSSERNNIGTQRIAYAQDWIQEFQVMTGQYSAEFGQASGGVLNAVTKSGSNQTLGRAYGFFRDDAWDAMPTFATRKPPLEQQRAGGTVGGPLRRNSIFYFAGVEVLNNNSSNIVNSSFPEANVTVPFAQDQQLYLGKVDYTVTPAHTLRVRYNTQRVDTTGSGIGGQNTEEHGRQGTTRATDTIFNWTWAASDRWLHETRVAYGSFMGGDTCNYAERNPSGPWFMLDYPAANFRCPVNFGRIGERQYHALHNVSWNAGAHQVKLGAQVQRLRHHGNFRNSADGQYAFERDIPFALDNPASYPYLFRVDVPTTTAFDMRSWSVGGFVQDSWSVNQDFTLNAGLRYDIDTIFTSLNPYVRLDRGMHTINLDANNFAPRVGFAWTPFDDRKRTLIRGGAGLYYDQNHNNIAGILVQNNIQVDRSITINANVPFENPFGTPAAARRFLAEALAQNRIPDLSSVAATIRNTVDVDEDFRVPASAQFSGGIARQFSPGLSLTADVLYTRGVDQYLSRNVNIDPVTLQPINPNYNGISSWGNIGKTHYRALQLQANWAASARHLMKLAYTLANTTSNTSSTLSGGNATNPFDPSEDQGPADNDVRHVLSVNGSTRLPLGIEAAGIVSYRSALPYSATTNEQLDSDPWPDRPEPRNARRGDSALSVDVRLSKLIPLGRVGTGMAFVELFNLTNRVNYESFIGTITSTSFGQPTTAAPMRRVQLGFRLDFSGTRP